MTHGFFIKFTLNAQKDFILCLWFSRKNIKVAASGCGTAARVSKTAAAQMWIKK